MSENAVATVESNGTLNGDILHQLVQGDIGKLSPDDRVRYVVGLCQSLGLNPATGPVQILTLKGKTVVYLRKDATEQLRKIHNVSLQITRTEMADGVFTVTVRATLPSGRTDEATGSVWVGQLQGEDRANAQMKAETKAKRRATLSICGLGFLDESEVADIRPEPVPVEVRPVAPKKPDPAPADDLEPAITAEQKDELDQLLTHTGTSLAQLEAGCKKRFGLADYRLLSERQAQQVIDGLKARRDEQQAKQKKQPAVA